MTVRTMTMMMAMTTTTTKTTITTTTSTTNKCAPRLLLEKEMLTLRLYSLHLILKIMLLKSCHKYKCNRTFYATTFVYT
jgi:hypothetical protein